MGTGKISIQVPVYNAEKFVTGSLRSLLAEPAPELEVIALDDGSSDRTPALLRELAETDPRLRLERNPRNLGEAGSRQRMVEMTDAEFIVPFDADDVFFPGRLERQRAALAARPDAAAVYGKTLAWDMADNRLFYYSGRPFSNFMIFSGNPLGHGSIMFRRDALLAAGGYLEPYRDGESLPVSCDFFMWLRLAQAGPLLFDRQFAYLYRLHQTQSAQTKTPLFAKAHQFISAWFKEQHAPLLQALLNREQVPCRPEQQARLMQALGFLTVALRGAGADPLPFIRCADQIDPSDAGPLTAEFEHWRQRSEAKQAEAVLDRMEERFAAEPFVLMAALKLRRELCGKGDTGRLARLEATCLGTGEEHRRWFAAVAGFAAPPTPL